MIMEITALRARLTDLEEENLNLKKQIRKEVQEEYEALVQALFVTCLHIKVSDLGGMSGQSCGDPGVPASHGGCTEGSVTKWALGQEVVGAKNAPALGFHWREWVSNGWSLFYQKRHWILNNLDICYFPHSTALLPSDCCWGKGEFFFSQTPTVLCYSFVYWMTIQNRRGQYPGPGQAPM